MKELIKIILTVAIATTFLVGCETLPNPTIDTSPVYPISGEWWVNYKVNGTDVLGIGWVKLLTSNSAANISTEILLTGKTRLFDLTFKAISNVPQRTFVTTSSQNMAGIDTTKQYFNTFTITNGKVIVNGTKSNTSVVTDSIYFELQVDDPTKLGLAAGTKLIVSGKIRTGFPADDY